MSWFIYVLNGTTYILAMIFIVLIVLIIYLKLTIGRFNSSVGLLGKTTLITGADSGIGYETALDFAKRGAKVIMASHIDEKFGKAAAERIVLKTDNKNVFFKHMDLSSLISVRKFAEEINKSEKRLDILVNNAGALDRHHVETEDGLLLLMQTNYFGPYLLTILLLDLMKKTSSSRIVNVASAIANYYIGCLDLNYLNYIPQHNNRLIKNLTVYTRSKLCVILFTIALANRLKNTNVTTYSVHPGATRTSIIQIPGFFSMRFIKFISPLFFKSPFDGAQTTIYCSITKGIENLSGQHFHDCRPVKRYKSAQDSDLVEKLWKITETLLKLD